MIFPSAPIGITTVWVNGSNWRGSWAGFDFTRAELRSGSIWSRADYHLGVPWMHPDDEAFYGRDPDSEGIYRVRVKRPWKSFVQVDGTWLVSKAPRQEGRYGTPPSSQISAIIELSGVPS